MNLTKHNYRLVVSVTTVFLKLDEKAIKARNILVSVNFYDGFKDDFDLMD